MLTNKRHNVSACRGSDSIRFSVERLSLLFVRLIGLVVAPVVPEEHTVLPQWHGTSDTSFSGRIFHSRTDENRNYSGISHYGRGHRLLDRRYKNSSLDEYGFVYLDGVG